MANEPNEEMKLYFSMLANFLNNMTKHDVSIGTGAVILVKTYCVLTNVLSELGVITREKLNDVEAYYKQNASQHINAGFLDAVKELFKGKDSGTKDVDV